MDVPIRHCVRAFSDFGQDLHSGRAGTSNVAQMVQRVPATTVHRLDVLATYRLAEPFEVEPFFIWELVPEKLGACHRCVGILALRRQLNHSSFLPHLKQWHHLVAIIPAENFFFFGIHEVHWLMLFLAGSRWILVYSKRQMLDAFPDYRGRCAANHVRPKPRKQTECPKLFT